MALLVCSTNQRKIWCSSSLLWVIFLRFFSRVNCVCGHTIQSYHCKSDQHSELISANFYKNYFTEIYGIFPFRNFRLLQYKCSSIELRDRKSDTLEFHLSPQQGKDIPVFSRNTSLSGLFIHWLCPTLTIRNPLT